MRIFCTGLESRAGDGQCWYSERATESRLDLTRKWIHWREQSVEGIN